VLRHHTHVLRLMGDGAWEVHEASAYQFDGQVAQLRSGAATPQPARQARKVAAAG
jgi:putative ATP-binding cassette transporter